MNLRGFSEWRKQYYLTLIAIGLKKMLSDLSLNSSLLFKSRREVVY